MARILLLGYDPPPLKSQSKVEAAHYRTWQFLEPLLDDGHTVCLCAASNPNKAQPFSLPDDWAKQLVYHAVPLRRQLGWVKQLQKIHDAFNPDCIVAVNFDCCLSATQLRTNKPIWMDIYGDYLTIIQVSRYRMRSDQAISTSITFVKKVLQKGDIFSGCSALQTHALVGELAMAGRLNWRTFGYDFTRIVLPGARPIITQVAQRQERPRLASFGVPKDSFVVLWCGGYNAWTDVKTLFAGLESAMAQEPKVCYVSVGASTYGESDDAYSQLLDMVEKSPYRDRFYMLGWRPWQEVADYYRESDVGLNIDALHYETIYGTRTRLVEMMAAGLPVITSVGCELSDLLGQRGAGLTFETGDWRGLSNQILALAKDEKFRQTMAESALGYANHELSFATTLLPVRDWVKAPQLAPDKVSIKFQEKLARLEYKSRSMVRNLMWQVAGLDRVFD